MQFNIFRLFCCCYRCLFFFIIALYCASLLSLRYVFNFHRTNEQIFFVFRFVFLLFHFNNFSRFFFFFFFSLQNLERKEKHQATQLEQLTKKQIFLKWRCEQLISYNEALCKRRSVSECSTSTISSTNSYELTRSSSSICESGALSFRPFPCLITLHIESFSILWDGWLVGSLSRSVWWHHMQKVSLQRPSTSTLLYFNYCYQFTSLNILLHVDFLTQGIPFIRWVRTSIVPMNVLMKKHKFEIFVLKNLRNQPVSFTERARMEPWIPYRISSHRSCFLPYNYSASRSAE